MQIFLDTSDFSRILKYSKIRLIEGVTTNPSLLSKSSVDRDDFLVKILNSVRLESVSAEMVSETAQEMVKEAKLLIEKCKKCKYAEAITIKLPTNFEGLVACRELSNIGVKVNMTLCFSVSQAVLAAKAGATYISPFLGRLDDNGKSGINILKNIIISYQNYGFTTKVLAASIRNLEHFENVCIIGSNAITIPPNILDEIVNNKLTKIGQEKFLKDFRNSQNK